MSDMCVVQCVTSSKNEWVGAQLEELIDLWEEQRILYDVTHCDYKNRRKKNRIMEEIAAHVNRPGDEVKTKLKNLRSQFLAEIRKQRDSAKKGEDGGGLYTSKWKYFGRLSFILTNYPIADIGNMSASHENHDSSNDEDDTTFDATDDSTGPIIKQEVARYKPKKNKRQKKNPDPVYQPEDALEKSTQRVEVLLPSRELERERQPDREDGCDIFGRHVANELRNLNTRHCQLAKLKIQQVLYEIQTAQSIETNHSFNHATTESSPLDGMSHSYKGSNNDADKDPLI